MLMQDQHMRVTLPTYALFAAGGWFSIMMALIFGGIMLLWFWGSTHKQAFFATHFNAHIKRLEDLLVATIDSQDETAPHKLRLVHDDKQVSVTAVIQGVVAHVTFVMLVLR